MSDLFKEYGSFIVGILIFVAVVLGFIYYHENEGKIDAKSEEVYCTVDDKDTYMIIAGKTPIRKHKLYLSPEGDDRQSYEATVSSSLYDDVEIGDSVKCIIFYKDNGISAIEVVE